MSSETETQTAAAISLPCVTNSISPDAALLGELHQRVGRNLLAYQAIEWAMKYLVADALVEGATPHTVAENARKRTERFFVQTMGQVAKALFEEVLTATPPQTRKRTLPTELRIRTRFIFESSQPDGWAALQQLCEEVLKTRNELVHYLMRQWASQSDEALRHLIAHLDETHAVAVSVRSQLDDLVRAQKSGRQELASYFTSAEGQADFLVQLACGNVTAALRAVAEVSCRSDGWVIVAGALGRLGGDPRLKRDVELLKEHWGRKTWWRRLFTERQDEFEFGEEAVPNAITPPLTRGVYRPAATG